MNIFGIGFLVLISLIGGVIAVLADNLGRTLGKKRLTFMKLRPRRTAQLFTFAAGAMIPLLTVGTVFLLSQDVRRWFVEGPQIVEERDRLSNELGDLKGTINELEGQRASRSAEVVNLTKQSADLRKKLNDSQAKLRDADAKVGELNRKLAPLQARLAKADREYRALVLSSRSLRTENARYLAMAQKAKDDYDDTKKVFDELNRQKSQAEEYQRELDRENQRLERESKTLLAAIESNKGEVVRLQTELARAKEDFDRTKSGLERETDLLKIERDRLTGQIRSTQEQLDALMSIWGNSRQLPMMFGMGDEVARVSVPANMSRVDAQNNLARLLRAARSAAEAKGAKSKGPTPSAGIMDRVVENRAITSEMQQQRIVDRLTGLSEAFVLVAYSSLNAFKGEPVSLEIQSFRNPLVFPAGELVAETRIDGDETENVLVGQIRDFVAKVVHPKAKSKGMVPFQGEGTGYRELGLDEVLDLMRTAKANNRRVRLQALAARDLFAGDPLDLEYRIR